MSRIRGQAAASRIDPQGAWERTLGRRARPCLRLAGFLALAARSATEAAERIHCCGMRQASGVCECLGLPQVEADDLVQSLYLAASADHWAAVRRAVPETPLPAWCRGVLWNLARRAAREAKFERRARRRWARRRRGPAEASPAVTRRGLRELLAGVWLPANERRVLTLRAAGAPDALISAALGLPAAHVRV